MNYNIFQGCNKHKNNTEFFELKRELFEGDCGTVNEAGLGTDINTFIDLLLHLKNNGFTNIHFGSDDPYCGVDISVAKLEKGK